MRWLKVKVKFKSPPPQAVPLLLLQGRLRKFYKIYRYSQLMMLFQAEAYKKFL